MSGAFLKRVVSAVVALVCLLPFVVLTSSAASLTTVSDSIRITVLDTGFSATAGGSGRSNVSNGTPVDCLSVVPGVACDATGHDHGTRTVGILLRSTTTGAAMNVRVRVIRVFDTNRHSTPEHILLALGMVLQEGNATYPMGPHILCLPLGLSDEGHRVRRDGDGITSSQGHHGHHHHYRHRDDEKKQQLYVDIATRLEQLASRGIVIITAAGNGGPLPGTVAALPGGLPYVVTVGSGACGGGGGIHRPSCAVHRTSARCGVFTPVISTTTTAVAHLRHHHHHHHAKPDIIAVGDAVTARGGTSAATAHVAGIAARILFVAAAASSPSSAEHVTCSMERNSTQQQRWCGHLRWQLYTVAFVKGVLMASAEPGSPNALNSEGAHKNGAAVVVPVNDDDDDRGGVFLARAYRRFALAASLDRAAAEGAGFVRDVPRVYEMARVLVADLIAAQRENVRLASLTYSIPDRITGRSSSLLSLSEMELLPGAVPRPFPFTVHTTACPAAQLHASNHSAVRVSVNHFNNGGGGGGGGDAHQANSDITSTPTRALLLRLLRVRIATTTAAAVGQPLPSSVGESSPFAIQGFTGGLSLAVGLSRRVWAADRAAVVALGPTVDVSGTFTISYECVATSNSTGVRFDLSIPFNLTIRTLPSHRLAGNDKTRAATRVLLDSSGADLSDPRKANSLLLMRLYISEVLGLAVDVFPLRDYWARESVHHDGWSPLPVRLPLLSFDVYVGISGGSCDGGGCNASDNFLARLLGQKPALRAVLIESPAPADVSSTVDTVDPIWLPCGDASSSSSNTLPADSVWRGAGYRTLSTSPGADMAAHRPDCLLRAHELIMTCAGRRPPLMAGGGGPTHGADIIATFYRVGTGGRVGVFSASVAECLLNPFARDGRGTTVPPSLTEVIQRMMVRLEKARARHTNSSSGGQTSRETEYRHLVEAESAAASTCLELMKEMLAAVTGVRNSNNSSSSLSWWTESMQCTRGSDHSEWSGNDPHGIFIAPATASALGRRYTCTDCSPGGHQAVTSQQQQQPWWWSRSWKTRRRPTASGAVALLTVAAAAVIWAFFFAL